MVPLVFKTSLGAVRSPEGSTPSLLRHVAPPFSTTEKDHYAAIGYGLVRTGGHGFRPEKTVEFVVRATTNVATVMALNHYYRGAGIFSEPLQVAATGKRM